MSELSVVIPTCDRPSLLAEALESVRAQSLQPAEIVVADNGREPVDAERLPCPVTLVSLPPRIGAGPARNAGAEKASSPWVAFLDDDDSWDPDYLAHMAGAIAKESTPPDCLIGRSEEVVDGQQRLHKCARNMDDLFPELFHRNPGVSGRNIVVRRKKLLDLGGFDGNLPTGQDRALVLDFILDGARIVCVPDAVAIRGHHDGERLTGAGFDVLYESKKRFLAKYGDRMGFAERLTAHRNLAALKARRRNPLYRVWVVGLTIARHGLLAARAAGMGHVPAFRARTGSEPD